MNKETKKQLIKEFRIEMIITTIIVIAELSILSIIIMFLIKG